MGIEYYAFALFVAGLICLVAILFRVLFADVKRQHKMLDEKETKILQLYRTVESIMEDFADQVKSATEEIREYESRVARRAASMTPAPAPPPPPEAVKKEQMERLPRSVTVDSSRIRAASEVLERAERIIKSDALKAPAKGRGGVVFQRFFDETASEQPENATAEAPDKQLRNDRILELSAEGKTDAQIASELGITRNEVKLVIGLTARK